VDGEPEATLRRRFEAGDLDGTLSFAIETYGAELYGFVAGLARNTGIADDVFGAMCERMWKGLPKFRWESSLRVWAYQIARNEFLRSTRRTNRGKRDLPSSSRARAR